MTKLPPDEAELFRNAMRDVRRQRAATPPPARPKPPAQARFTHADERAVLQESLAPITDYSLVETGEELSFRRDDVSPKVLRKLRSGHYAVAAELDLHGLNAIEARAALSDFVFNALAMRHGCVRIVHGKGNRSGPRGPVLKNVVNRWLLQCAAVCAFGSARPMDGGTGAVYVLLKS